MLPFMVNKDVYNICCAMTKSEGLQTATTSRNTLQSSSLLWPLTGGAGAAPNLRWQMITDCLPLCSCYSIRPGRLAAKWWTTKLEKRWRIALQDLRRTDGRHDRQAAGRQRGACKQSDDDHVRPMTSKHLPVTSHDGGVTYCYRCCCCCCCDLPWPTPRRHPDHRENASPASNTGGRRNQQFFVRYHSAIPLRAPRTDHIRTLHTNDLTYDNYLSGKNRTSNNLIYYYFRRKKLAVLPPSVYTALRLSLCVRAR